MTLSLKIILFLLLSTACLSSEVKQDKREFLSIGMLDENYSFVCINGEKWLEHKLPDKIELSKIYVFDEEQNKDISMECF